MKRSINIDTIQQEMYAAEQGIVPGTGTLAHLPLSAKEPGESSEPCLEKATVLLVDDEVHMLRGITRVLRKQPYTFYTVRSAEEAIEVMQNQPVDVVITDEKMPGMKGTELAAWIAQSHPEIKTIILTGYADVNTVIRAVNQGRIFRFFTKPCNAFDLVLAIYDAIQKE